MKLALILNVVDPLIGGVLIMGHRGTGKSTAVRALADLLPQISTAKGCPFNCDPKDSSSWCGACRDSSKLTTEMKSIPVVELPLGATEDRVCGTIAIERALREGVKTFEPGLLAHANRGFLYIDEVNLLEDHLVDLLLDVASTGRNRVEREGVSVEHPSQFVLVGSGNPEEGELRPQLLDRFGLHVDVTTTTNAEERIEIVNARDSYDRDPAAFYGAFVEQQESLRDRIVKARRSFEKVKISSELLRQIVEICVATRVDGHRGELTLMRASRALAALVGRKRVTEEDVRQVVAMCLRHRMRRNAFEETVSDEIISQIVNKQFSNEPQGSDRKSKGTEESSSSVREFPSPPAGGTSKLRLESDRSRRSGENVEKHSKRGQRSLNKDRGRHTRSVGNKRLATRVAVAATLQAIAALNSRPGSKLTPVNPNALRYKVLSRKQGTTFIFAIDTSGSMASRRIALAKRVMLDRLRQSYVNRDRIAILSFRGASGKVELQPTRSILRARRTVDSLEMGGGTPLVLGLLMALKMLTTLKDETENVVLLFTDGHANVPFQQMGGVIRERCSAAEWQRATDNQLRLVAAEYRKIAARVVVIDTQNAFESSEDTKRLAGLLNAQFVKMSDEL